MSFGRKRTPTEVVEMDWDAGFSFGRARMGLDATSENVKRYKCI